MEHFLFLHLLDKQKGDKMMIDTYTYNQNGLYPKVQHKDRSQNSRNNNQDSGSKQEQDDKKVTKRTTLLQTASIYAQKITVSEREVAKLLGLGVNLNILA